MPLVVDASVAIKWVVEEEGGVDALALLAAGDLIAPDLIVAECANILWKKTEHGAIGPQLARIAARVLAEAPIEIVPTRGLLEAATNLALMLKHPAYDCVYLALARARSLKLVTADDRLIRKLAQKSIREFQGIAMPLGEAAAGVKRGVK